MGSDPGFQVRSVPPGGTRSSSLNILSLVLFLVVERFVRPTHRLFRRDGLYLAAFNLGIASFCLFEPGGLDTVVGLHACIQAHDKAMGKPRPFRFGEAQEFLPDFLQGTYHSCRLLHSQGFLKKTRVRYQFFLHIS